MFVCVYRASVCVHVSVHTKSRRARSCLRARVVVSTGTSGHVSCLNVRLCACVRVCVCVSAHAYSLYLTWPRSCSGVIWLFFLPSSEPRDEQSCVEQLSKE